MKLRFLFSLMLGASLAAGAQGGYQDGVDNYNADRLDVAKVILGNTINDAATNKAVAYYYMGQIDYAENNLAGAKANFDKGAQADPNYAYNYVGQGMLALKSGNKTEAQRLFDQALKLDKKNTAIMAAVARAYWTVDPVAYSKDIDKLISKALKESKNTESAVYMLQGDMAAATDPGEAAGKYEMAIEQDKAKGIVNREAYVKYAHVYDKHNRALVIEKLEELNRLEPNSGLAQRELAEQYYENQQMGRAWKQYEKYVENPNHFRRDEQRYTGLLYSAKEYDKSIQWANKVLSEDPSVYQMNRMLMLNYNALEQDSLAAIYGEKLLNYPGADLVANDYLTYGNILVDLGRAPEAVVYVEKAVEMSPDKPELLTTLSKTYQKAGQEDKALETMKRYLDTGEASATDYYSMANTYWAKARKLEKGTPERLESCAEGVKYVNMALERAPGNPALLMMKVYLIVTGNDDKPNADAIKVTEELIEATQGEPEKYKNMLAASYYYNGAYYADLKDNAKAREFFEKYLEINPNDQGVKNLLEIMK